MNEINQYSSLSNRDANLLVAFSALLQFRHVTRAAEALSISQSAMSHTLARLRRTFEDDLFVKVPRGVEPTPKAQELAPLVSQAVKALNLAFTGQSAFDPRTLRRTFRVSTTDLIEILLAPAMIALQKEQGPDIQTAFMDVGFSLPKKELRTGELDLAIAGFFGDLPDDFYKQTLFEDEFLVCMAPSGKKNLRKLTIEDYTRRSHILIAPRGNLQGLVDHKLKELGLTRRVILGSGGFLAAGWAVASCQDIALTAPASLVRQFEKTFGLQSFSVPFYLPKIEIIQVWHRRCHQDPAHRWYRQKVFQSLR